MKLCRRLILFDKIWTVEIKAREPHDHSPPHHCAYLSRPAVHCTPLAHAADRWRSVCTMTDALAQSHLGLRRTHVRTPTSAWRRRSVRQTSLFQPPPPHAHAHTPPHHCAYAPRPVVHCTPLAHAADRWRSVCTMTDAPAQGRLWLRRSHVHPVPRVTPQSAPLCARLKIDFHLAPLAHGCCTFRARLAYLLRTHPNRLRYPSMKPNVHTMTARWL